MKPAPKPADHDPLIFYTDDAPAWKVAGFWVMVVAVCGLAIFGYFRLRLPPNPELPRVEAICVTLVDRFGGETGCIMQVGRWRDGRLIVTLPAVRMRVADSYRIYALNR